MVQKKKKIVTLSSKVREEERKRAYNLIMDLYYALKANKSEPSLGDLSRLANSIMGK